MHVGLQAQNNVGGGRGVGDIARDWDYRAFKSENEADTLHTSLTGKSKDAGKTQR